MKIKKIGSGKLKVKYSKKRGEGVRAILSIGVICLSAVLFVLYCVTNNSSAKSVSTNPAPSSAASSVSNAAVVGIQSESNITAEGVGTASESMKAKKISDWRLILVNYENHIPDEYSFTPEFFEQETVDARIYGELSDMLSAAWNAGVDIWVASSYRDKETQTIILQNAINNRMDQYEMTEEEATENALLTIAKPGYSEHETGLVIDFNDVSMDFENTDAYTWLSSNAADYGFVQRYPADKEKITKINVEPWHYRYVGVDNAKKMEELGLCLEEYIEYLKAA